jgi:hypothetical protein
MGGDHVSMSPIVYSAEYVDAGALGTGGRGQHLVQVGPGERFVQDV